MAHVIEANCIGCTACVLACPVDCISGRWLELHTINAATCIDCGACLAICPADAIIGTNGAARQGQERVAKRSHWPEPVVDPDFCTGCHFCIDICPTDCLEMTVENALPGIARLARPQYCIGCRQCAEVCAKGAITMLVPTPAVPC